MSTIARFTQFFDDPALKNAATRSAAQAAAARANGSKSTGPVTAAGKAISVRNATKHGLFAQQAAPPADQRQFDRMFHSIRRHLIAEFGPLTFTQQLLVDGIARDSLNALRAGRMIEEAFRPPRLPADDERKLQDVRRAQRNLRLARQTLAMLASGEALTLTPGRAKALAQYVADRMAGVAATLAQDADPDVDPLTPEDKILRQPLDNLLAAVKTAWRKYAKPERVRALLTGQKHLHPSARKHLEAILRYGLAVTKRSLEWQKEFVDEIQRSSERHLAGVAKAPEKLLLLQLYLGRFERSMERKLDRLCVR